jgi:hypothetical protein
MSAVAPSPPNAKRHVYKLALYGRKNSGKSCILAALALGLERVPNPDGLGCVWVCDETTVPVPKGPRDSWDLTAPETTRHLGREWLKRAVERLKAGDVPPPTPTNVAPFRFFFDLTDRKTGRTFRVEMVDYSGELVRPEASEETFAKTLREHLETLDGILVLGEAPRRDEESQPLYKELSLLLDAFTLLADQRHGKKVHPFPVALVFNKWDRQSRMQRYSSGEAGVEVDLFLRRDPPPPQLGLLNVLETVSGNTPERSNCRPFALSAFGKAVTVTRTTEDGKQVVIDVPASAIPLPAYGLEDPFVWLCKRADEIEAERLATGVERLRFWDLPQARRGEALASVRDLPRFIDRFPKSAPERKTAESLAERARTALWQQLGFAAGLAAVLFFLTVNGGFYGYDQVKYHGVERTVEKADDDKPLANWRAAEAYLASYVQSNWYRVMSHLAFKTPAVARGLLDSVRQHVSVASDIEAKLEGLEQRRDAATAETALNGIQADAQRLEVPGDLLFLANRKTNLMTSLAKKIDDLGARTEEGKKRNAFRKLLDGFEFAKAANYVGGGEVAAMSGLREKLTEEFKTQAPLLLKNRVGYLAARDGWRDAEALINSFRSSEAVRDVLQNPVLLGKLNNLERWVKVHRQETLYKRWSGYHDANTGQQILSGDDDRYKPAVDSYNRFQKSMTDQQNWSLRISEIQLDHLGELRKTWGLRVELRSRDGSFIDAIEGKFEVQQTGRTSWPGTKLLATPRIRANDEIILDFKMKADNWRKTWNVGEARHPTSVLNLKPLTVQLEDNPTDPYWSYYFPKYSPPRVVMAVDSPEIPTLRELPSPQDPPSIDTVLFP